MWPYDEADDTDLTLPHHGANRHLCCPGCDYRNQLPFTMTNGKNCIWCPFFHLPTTAPSICPLFILVFILILIIQRPTLKRIPKPQTCLPLYVLCSSTDVTLFIYQSSHIWYHIIYSSCSEPRNSMRI
jgi:hypothetical protein